MTRSSPSSPRRAIRSGMPNYFAPKSDTVVFEGRPHTEAHLLPATGQCAMSKSSEVVAMITSWLRAQFTDFHRCSNSACGSDARARMHSAQGVRGGRRTGQYGKRVRSQMHSVVRLAADPRPPPNRHALDATPADGAAFSGVGCGQVGQVFSTAEPLVSRCPEVAMCGPGAIR